MPKILLGFMGAGKTTIGRLLDPNFHDMDAELVLELGMPVAQYFASYGEESFRSKAPTARKRWSYFNGWWLGHASGKSGTFKN